MGVVVEGAEVGANVERVSGHVIATVPEMGDTGGEWQGVHAHHIHIVQAPLQSIGVLETLHCRGACVGGWMCARHVMQLCAAPQRSIPLEAGHAGVHSAHVHIRIRCHATTWKVAKLLGWGVACKPQLLEQCMQSGQMICTVQLPIEGQCLGGAYKYNVAFRHGSIAVSRLNSCWIGRFRISMVAQHVCLGPQRCSQGPL